MNNDYTIRNLKKPEMQQMLAMASAEGWNPGLLDEASFFHADTAGFFVGELKGEPISFIAAVNYNNCYGFIGLYIVKPGYRGLGYGLKIWNHAIDYLGNVVSGLDGVPAQVENYKKSGFVYAFRQMRLATKAIRNQPSENIHTYHPDKAQEIVAYDTTVFGTSRKAFLQSWLHMENAQVVYAQNKETITGYAVIRACVEGYKIGPLFADNATIAEQLFLACHQKAPAEANVYIDMPEPNPARIPFTQKYQMQLVFETARMYKNGQPQFPLEKVYGVTSFELG